MLSVEGCIQGHGCCLSLAWDERVNMVSVSCRKRECQSPVDREIRVAWCSPSTSTAVVGCRDSTALQQGNSVRKRSFVKLLGHVRQHQGRPGANTSSSVARCTCAGCRDGGGLQAGEHNFRIASAPLANATIPFIRENFTGF